MYLGVWARNDPHARVSTCSASTSTPTTPLHVPPNCQTRVQESDGIQHLPRIRLSQHSNLFRERRASQRTASTHLAEASMSFNYADPFRAGYTEHLCEEGD